MVSPSQKGDVRVPIMFYSPTNGSLCQSPSPVPWISGKASVGLLYLYIHTQKKKNNNNNKTLSIFLTAIILTLKNEYPSTGQLLSSGHWLSSWLQRSGNFPNFQGSPSLSFFIKWPMVSRTKAQLHKRDAPHSSSQSALE